MRKNEVQFHSDGCCRRANPAVNVKVHSFTTAREIAEHFKCSEAQAEQAGEFQFQSACEMFWESAQEYARECFGAGVKCYSEGRSSGWCVIHGLPDFDSWDAIQLSKWAKFERMIKAEVKYRMSREMVFEDIEANEWHKDGSEQYNFIDKKNGETVCIADLKKQAVEQGFGAVVK